jgi:pentatricopeptide repeat protein
MSLLDEMENEYTDENETIRPNSYTLSAILLGIDDGAEALDTLDRFEVSYGLDYEIITVQVYNAAISACCRSHRDNKNRVSYVEGWQLGLSLYNKMKRQGPTPNEQTYLAVLQALAEFGQVRVALSIFDEMQQNCTADLSSKLYKPLLKSCVTAEKADAAESLIQRMKNDSIKITTEHMNLLLLTLAKCKMHNRSMEVLKEMIELQDSYPSIAPDIITFNTVLSSLANADDYEAARDLLNDMKNGVFSVPVEGDGLQSSMMEVRPDIISYNTVISCADPVAALELINEIKLTRRNRKGVIYPNSITYTNAIARCRKASTSSDPEIRQYAFDIAFNLFQLAQNSAADNTGPGIDLNVYLYSSLIWVAESVGNYKAAVHLLRTMKCSPNSICYDGVISALSKRGLHRESLYFYYEMQKLSLKATRNVYLKLAFVINNARDPELFSSPRKKAALLEGVLSQMSERDRSVSIGGPLLEMLIRCHGSNAEPGSSHLAARKVFDQIVGPVDNACLSAMVRVYSSTSMWEEAVLLLHCSDIVREARGPGRVSLRALSYAVIACAKANEYEEAFNLIDLYRDDSSHRTKQEVVTIAALNSLIGACCRSQRPDIAVQLLNDMKMNYGVSPDAMSYRLAIIACNQAEHREAKDAKQLSRKNAHSEFTWWECALSLLRRMIEDGLKPDSKTYSSVVSALESGKIFRTSSNCYDYMKIDGRTVFCSWAMAKSHWSFAIDAIYFIASW